MGFISKVVTGLFVIGAGALVQRLGDGVISAFGVPGLGPINYSLISKIGGFLLIGIGGILILVAILHAILQGLIKKISGSPKDNREKRRRQSPKEPPSSEPMRDGNGREPPEDGRDKRRERRR